MEIMDSKQQMDINKSLINNIFHHENVRNRQINVILCTQLDRAKGEMILAFLIGFLKSQVSFLIFMELHYISSLVVKELI